MDAYLSIIESADICSLGFVIMLLAAVGACMAGNTPRLRVLGWRIAAGAFVLYGMYAVALGRTTDAAELALILIRAVLAGGLTLGLAWVLLPAGVFIVRTLAVHPVTKGRAALHTLLANRRAAQEELERVRAELDWKAAELASAETRYRQAAEVNRTDREAQRRRDNARAGCELLYAQYAPELEQRFSRNAFAKFIADYMGDERSPEEVEQRAEQLSEALRVHRQILDPAHRFGTLRELTAWYDEQRQQVQSAGLHPDSAEVLLVNLEIHYEELLRRFIQEG
ncbi:MAG: hypothetical protein DWQ37_20150 [Planctomycetota bacterium]|nr:MAG: hypothetical protein DWQ37_20150 [Planctomycetota bacterium]